MKKIIILPVLVMLIIVACGTIAYPESMNFQENKTPITILTLTPTPSSTSVPIPTSTVWWPDLLTPTTQIELRDPSWDEMVYFLNHNHINWNEYLAKEYTYVCHHFACDVCLAAREQGIRCAYVAIGFPKKGHASIAFETTDQGLIYFEPQYDHRMKIEIGRKYWSWIYWPDYDYELDYDDTVVSILLTWNTDPDGPLFPCESWQE